MTDMQTAIVLFSGGQDSSTCLAWALDRFQRVETVAFDYGQRHRVELDARLAIRDQFNRRFPRWRDRLGDDHLVDLTALNRLTETSLTRDMAIKVVEEGLPNTFVPGRNLLFLTYAAVIAWRRGAKNLVTGVCETDFSGYPDCRDDTIKALQVALNLGMEKRFVIHTPLMWIDKAETWRLAEKLGGAELINIIVQHSHTCYNGDRSKSWAWGFGCGECPACQLRARGYEAFQQAA
jgi:7-cyano-7-deazaguanine synthase